MSDRKDPLVSIVVPVYNVEQYLDRCISSLVNQTYSQIEIILVDDGSTDRSGDICNEWKKKDKRITVVHKKNAGLGYARNTGLQCCCGEYITFVDSDDFIEINMLEEMVTCLLLAQADTCYCSYNIFSNKHNSVISRACANPGVFGGKEVLFDIIGAEPSSKLDFVKGMSVWACLFSTNIIKSNRIEFNSEREYICEDLLFDLLYLQNAQKVLILDLPLYNYCINEHSLTHKFYPNRLEKEVNLFKYVNQYLEVLFPSGEYRIRYAKLFLGRIRNSIIQIVWDSHDSFLAKLKAIGAIAKDAVVESVIREYPIAQNPFKQKVFNCFLKHRISIGLYGLAKLKRRKL